MDVALKGPQGYEYQYIVTALIAIQHAHDETAKIIVEKIGGEDAELTIEVNSVTSTIEIQSKGTNKDLDLEALADWLLHFAERDADDFLLKRLKNDQNRTVVIVTQARCLDETHKFANVLSFRPHTGSPLSTKEDREKFLAELRSKKTSTTALGKKRAASSESIADELKDTTKLEDVTKRVVIWESLRDTYIEERIQVELNRKFRIPQSQTYTLLLQILAAIRAARDIHGDALPEIRDLLRKNAAEAVFGNNIYKERKELTTLTSILNTKQILLLTGASLCGKSYTARYLAQRFQEQGCSILRTDNLREANRFLSDTINEDRLCILEDPFGHIRLRTDVDPISLRRELSEIVSELRSHRRLIVTTRSDILIAVYSVSSSAEARISEHQWQDLTVLDKDFLKSLWQEMIAGRGIPQEVIDSISLSIDAASPASLLQPGQLKHLAREDPAQLQGMNTGQLMHIAKVDAKDLGESWSRRGQVFRRLAVALSLTTTTIQKVHISELTFVLSDSNDTPSLLLKKHDGGVTMGFGIETDEPPAYPTYAPIAKLASDYSAALELLESHGYIQLNNEFLVFGHPNYQAAFDYITENLLESQFDDFIAIATRGISVLNPIVALNVSRLLTRLCEIYSKKPGKRQRILEVIYNSLQSIYPSVIDGALVSLLKFADNLTKTMRDKIFRMVSRPVGIERICWHNGLCWLNYQPSINISWSSALESSYTISLDRIKAATADLSDPNMITNVSAEEAWNILQAIKRKDIESNSMVLYQRLLAYEESFIRRKAAWNLALKFSKSDPDVIGRLLADEHPSVAFQAIRGCFACWKDYPEEAKPQLCEALKQSLARPEVAIAARRFLSDFGDHYGADHVERKEITPEQEKSLWELWGSVFPSFLRSLPEASIGIDQPHLWNTAQKACEYILPEQGLEIAEAWFEWVEQKLKHSLPHDYGLGLAEFLVNATKAKADLRFELFKRILNHPDSHLIFVAIADLVDAWSDLTDQEREFMCSTISGGRTDARWLKAVALTRVHVPTEIEKLILGTGGSLASDADVLVREMDPALLSDCLHVYCGTPQPLWWLGKHHSRTEIWRRLMIKICERPEHPLFELSLNEIIAHEQNPDSSDGPQVWELLCKTADPRLRERLFQILLKCSIEGDVVTEYWTPLIKPAPKDEKKRYVSELIENLSKIENRDHNQPWTVIGEYTFFKLILPRLPNDRFIIEALSLFGSISQTQDTIFKLDDGVKGKLISLVKSIYDSSPPILLMTHEMVKTWLGKEDKKLTDEAFADAKTLIDAASAARAARFQQWKDEPYVPEPHGLQQWNTTYVERES